MGALDYENVALLYANTRGVEVRGDLVDGYTVKVRELEWDVGERPTRSVRYPNGMTYMLKLL